MCLLAYVSAKSRKMCRLWPSAAKMTKCKLCELVLWGKLRASNQRIAAATPLMELSGLRLCAVLSTYTCIGQATTYNWQARLPLVGHGTTKGL